MVVMEFCCDLEADVNGEEIFVVDKRVVSSFSVKLRHLFGKSNGTQAFKVIFPNFPGGAEGFELMARFCYNNGITEIGPSNIALLHCIAQFMEMNRSASGTSNLLEQTENSMDEIRYWTWTDLLVAVKQSQNLITAVNCSGLLQKCIDALVGRLANALSDDASPCPSTSSIDSSGVRASFDSKSAESLKTATFGMYWWFEDFLVLNPNTIEMLVQSMVSQKFEHGTVSRFLFYYHKSKLATASSHERCKITEKVVVLLFSLDWSHVSCKSLFGILHATSNLNVHQCCKNRLESMIGSQLDQAKLDNLLQPSPHGVNFLYDVDIVLRFLEAFMSNMDLGKDPPVRLKKVCSLIDDYIAEVAPDPHLKPSKFLALVMALPDFARDCCDGIYRAVDMYLQMHAGLSKHKLMKIYSVINYEKLSTEAFAHLSQNTRFPSTSVAHLLGCQEYKPKSLNQENKWQSDPTVELPLTKGEENEQVVLYEGKPGAMISLAETEDLKEQLEGMQCRVNELEEVCRQMQTQVKKITKTKSSHSSYKSLPKLCS